MGLLSIGKVMEVFSSANTRTPTEEKVRTMSSNQMARTHYSISSMMKTDGK